METASAHLYEFGEFRLDSEKRLLRRNDTQVPLTPRVFDTLLYLVTHNGALLETERLMDAVWPDSIVEENNLTQNISTLRRVFGETPGSHRFIVTVPGRGYRFVADVKKRDNLGSVEPALHRESLRPEPGNGAEPEAKSAYAGGGRRAATMALLLGMLFLAAGIAAFWASRSKRAPSSESTPPPPPKSIAVLPFDNLSDDPQNAYFVAGVQDEILSNLAKIADLKVISRTSANLYKTGAPRNTREIGQQLRVAHLVEGSVQRNGDRVRIHAQLIDTRNDSHLWAQSYDRQLADVFAIQSEIAETIANQLHATISASEKAAVALPLTRDLLAKDLYLRAMAARSETIGIQALLNAIDLLEQAVARDPGFAEAYCVLASSHVDLYSNGYNHTPAHLDMVNGIIERAAHLQPDSGKVRLTRAHYLARGRRNYDQARTELELARRVLPNDATFYNEIALTDRRQGRWSEAVANFERAIELDPLNSTNVIEASSTYASMKRYSEAARLARRAVALAPRVHSVRLLAAYQSFSESADLGPWRAELDAVLTERAGAARDIGEELFSCAHLQRDRAAMERALAAIPPEGVVGAADTVFPREWYMAVTAQSSNQPEAARTAFSGARSILEGILHDQPDYAFTWSLLGRVEAALGNKEKAVEAGRRACELLPLDREPTSGVKPLNDLARIYAAVGEKDRALEILSSYLGQIGFTDYGHLKLEPDWDPLRGDQRFEKIVASLAPKPSG